MKKQILLAAVFFLSFSCYGQLDDQAYIHDVTIKETCSGEKIKYKLNLGYYGDDQVQLSCLGSNIKSLKLYFRENEIQMHETMHFLESKDFGKVQLQFSIEEGKDIPQIFFKQTINNKSKIDTINVFKGVFLVSDVDQDIIISESCKDSIILSLPFVGTQTDVRLFYQEDGKYVQSDYFSYYCGFGGNTLKFSRDDLKKIKIGITGCHTPYKEFLLTLK